MSFHDVRLPEDIERGAVGGPRFKTTVLQLDSGFEQRNVDWTQARAEYDIGYGLMSMDDDSLGTYIHKVRDFFYARRGRAYGFRFKDWADFEIGNPDDPLVTDGYQVLALGDGVTTQFQVYKRYSSGGVLFDRLINKLVSGSVSVLLDGVVQSTGVAVDMTTGVLTFTSPPATTGGDGPGGERIIGIACEFDVPVRFDDDHLKISVDALQAGSVPSIPVIELKPRDYTA